MATTEVVKEAVKSILAKQKPVKMMLLGELLEKTKMSRPTLREHLRKIEEDGEVEVLNHRGYIVIAKENE